jgi:hypothetical protein
MLLWYIFNVTQIIYNKNRKRYGVYFGFIDGKLRVKCSIGVNLKESLMGELKIIGFFLHHVFFKR